MKVAVIGLGYVGLPLSLEFARAGCTVLALDTDPAKPERLCAGDSYLKHVRTSDLKELTQSGRFLPGSDFSRLAEAEAAILCVPTPLTEAREPDLQYVEASARTVARYLHRGQLVVLESTTYPGTTEEVVLPLLEQSGLRCPVRGQPGEAAPDFYLAYSPERIDPGNQNFPLRAIPKIVGGANPASAERARQLYQKVFDQVIVVSSTRAAEMTKLLENVYRGVNIALVNELKLMAERLGVDIWEIIGAAATKPFGFTPFYPGPGLGGHCLPIDPFYLAWKARQHGMESRFIELAGEINTAMPQHVVETTVAALAARGKPIRGARVLILGAAYKKDIDDLRESPALAIMQLLEEQGAELAYNDPHIPRLPRTRRHDFSRLRSAPLDAATLAQCDCVILVTDHSAYDIGEIVRHARLLVDTRNATRTPAPNVIRC